MIGEWNDCSNICDAEHLKKSVTAYLKATRGKNVPDGSDQLLVYDLDGTMLRKYKLNRRVNGFDIDTVNQVLVMVNSNTEAPMYTFPLPEGF